jgi:hypothetical protein
MNAPALSRYIWILQLVMLAFISFLAARVVVRSMPALREWRARRGEANPPRLSPLRVATVAVAVLCLGGAVVSAVVLVRNLARLP